MFECSKSFLKKKRLTFGIAKLIHLDLMIKSRRHIEYSKHKEVIVSEI